MKLEFLQALGDSGNIFAMDISAEMLQDVGMKIKSNNILNIEIILTEENDLKLEDNKITFAFISTVLHEADESENFFKEIKFKNFHSVLLYSNLYSY